MRYIVEHGQTTGSRQKIVCCGYSAARRCTRLISVPMAKVEPAGAAWMAFTMKSVEPAASAASTTAIGHSGCTMTCTPGCSARAWAIWSTVKRRCTEQKPCHRMTRASASSSTVLPPSALRGFHIGICSSGTPMALAVLRPRCWSGKNSTRCPRSNAHSSTVLAFDEVQTMPPLRPTNPLSAADEFM